MILSVKLVSFLDWVCRQKDFILPTLDKLQEMSLLLDILYPMDSNKCIQSTYGVFPKRKRNQQILELITPFSLT